MNTHLYSRLSRDVYRSSSDRRLELHLVVTATLQKEIP